MMFKGSYGPTFDVIYIREKMYALSGKKWHLLEIMKRCFQTLSILTSYVEI